MVPSTTFFNGDSPRSNGNVQYCFATGSIDVKSTSSSATIHAGGIAGYRYNSWEIPTGATVSGGLINNLDGEDIDDEYNENASFWTGSSYSGFSLEFWDTSNVGNTGYPRLKWE